MRRLATGILLTLGLVGAAVFGVAAGGGGGTYEIRAIFDDVASAVPGEDVKIAGAKVGKVGEMDVTADHKAAVQLKIDDAGFTPFHSDATCTIRPQSLIGEKFVECTPGSPSKPELREIREGQPGEGQHLLPLAQTSAPVDLDLINDVMRLPYRERFSIVLTELGAGLAGRGEDLNALIHRANPALRQTDRVLRQLADENVTLKRLATESDQALAPLARDRRHLAGFIQHANSVGEATAARRADIERSIALLPEFLRQLKPTMEDLGALADEMTPVLTDLGDASPSLSKFILQLGPFSRSASKSLTTLGDATDVGGPVLQRARPVVKDLKSFANTANPLSKTLDELTANLDKTGGLERAMDYIFFQMTAINGFDSIGHYLRAGLLVNVCSTYVTTATGGCEAHFSKTETVNSASAASLPDDAALAKTAIALRKATGSPAAADVANPAATSETPGQAVAAVVKGLLKLGTTDQADKERARRVRQLRAQAAADSSPALDGIGGKDAALLSYLMGSDG
jgi:phospholipid/cholesterol/gamma-HCH transport system substrate-binding protein